MAQHDYNIANQGFPAFRSDLNNALSAIQTTNSGTSRPSGAVAGQLWLDTTSATTPTLKYFDGTDDISLATIDHSANTVNWLDSTVSITGLSTTATGTVLTLSDSANTTTVNLILDNQKEIRFRETTANGTNYVALKAPASLSADLTFTLPSADGTSGQVLQTNGSGVLSFATVGGLAWQSIVTASTLTAVASRGYWIDTTSNACTVTLPASATNGDTIILADYARNWGTNAVTINPNSLKFQGGTANATYSTSGQSVTLVYSGATNGWIPTVDDDVTNTQSYSVEMLVVAGGGAGGQATDGGGGGGGAGGFRTSTQNFLTGSTYTVTVGAGGAKGTTNSNTTTGQGGNGGDSSVSGSGITTITSTGGGGGGAGGANNTSGQAGKSGGSGGGGGQYGTNVGGAGNTPSTSPSQGNNGGHMTGQPWNGGGGGGGANAVGGNVTTNLDAGAGGNGTASSITGSSVTYAGGGGGGVTNPNPVKPIAGGTGGGGAGAIEAGASAVAGTTNTGGGGGGGYGTPNKAGAGGSGVVILRMLTTKYSGTTTGSPTVTDDGSYKVLKYTGSGSYTA
jgi:hypothetical protein